MKRNAITLTLALCMLTVCNEQEQFPELSKHVPHLMQRMRSTRWQVRYSLQHALTGRDLETKRALETLARDEHERVANQALVRYLGHFVEIDRASCKPELYQPGKFPLTDLPDEDPYGALLDYCLGRREITPRKRTRHGPAPEGRALPVLDAAQREDPRMHGTLTIVGILGKREHAKALYPFLQSPNEYVALGAAKAVIRLGDRAKGVEALVRLTERDPEKHLFYVTEALYALRELGHRDLEAIVLRVLAAVDRLERMQPNWLNGFLLLAADVVGDRVWTATAHEGK